MASGLPVLAGGAVATVGGLDPTAWTKAVPVASDNAGTFTSRPGVRKIKPPWMSAEFQLTFEPSIAQAPLRMLSAWGGWQAVVDVDVVGAVDQHVGDAGPPEQRFERAGTQHVAAEGVMDGADRRVPTGRPVSRRAAATRRPA